MLSPHTMPSPQTTDQLIISRESAHNAQKVQRERDAYLLTASGKAELAQAAERAAHEDYQAAIMSLPEASERPRAATRFVLAYSAHSMPLARAKLFLAGLPVEEAEAVTLNPKAHKMADPTLKRRVEIRLAALSQRADQGDEAARSEAKRLSYGLKVAAETNLGLLAALEQSGANVAAIR